MRYDRTAEFIKYLHDDLMRQAKADRERGREKLASRLEGSAAKLYHEHQEIVSAWKICEPYMKDKQ